MRAPEFPNELKWFNSKPLQLKELRGKVVLIDFWTYSCVNCVRTLPRVKEWAEKYKNKGLVVVGVHTPEFEFEKDPRNVETAIRNFGIEYPVVLDADYLIWNLFSNNVWPRKFLLDAEGKIIYDHAGEGAYGETEQAIRAALLARKPDIKLPDAGAEAPPGTPGGVCLPATPETYLGSFRGRPGKTWEVQGAWKVYPEYVEHEERTEDYKDYLALHFEGAEVNVVAGGGERAARIKLTLNGEPLREVEIKDHKMYNLVSGNKQLKGELRLCVKEIGVRFFAFTFGGCVQNEEAIQN